MARKAGLSERAISQLSAGEPADDLSDAERIAQKFATQLTASRRIDDDLFASAKEMFGPKGVMDITSLIGAYQVVCGTLNGFAIPAPVSSTFSVDALPVLALQTQTCRVRARERMPHGGDWAVQH